MDFKTRVPVAQQIFCNNYVLAFGVRLQHYVYKLHKYAFSYSIGVLAHSLCSSTHTIEYEDEKQEPRMKARSGSFQSFLKPEIVSDIFCSGKMPKTIDVNVRMEKLRKLRFQMCPEEIEWKKVDHLLVEKSAASIVRDFTVHHQRSPLVVTKANEAPPQKETNPETEDQQCIQPQDDEDSVTSPFQLQQLDDSPRTSQLHIKDGQKPDGQEAQPQFYELGVPHNTPSDILEPTKQAFFNATGHQQVLVSPCLTTSGQGKVNPCITPFVGDVGEQCVITTKKASDQCVLVGCEGMRTSSYSTFRPPANPEDDKIFLQSSECRSKTPSPSTKQAEKPVALKNPDIGDEPIVPADCSTLKRKEALGLHVSAPVVPALEKDGSDQKKGWSITTV